MTLHGTMLSHLKPLKRNEIIRKTIPVPSPADKIRRKVPQLDAQNPSGEYRGEQQRFGARSAAWLPGNCSSWGTADRRSVGEGKSVSVPGRSRWWTNNTKKH